MKRIYKTTYLDGMVKFGKMQTIPDAEGYNIEKFYDMFGVVFYKIEQIRESDFLKFDTDKIKVTKKIKIQAHNDLKATHVLQFSDGELLKIEYIEPTKRGEYILYLSNYTDTLEDVIEIHYRKSTFECLEEKLLTKILSNVKFEQLTHENLANKTKSNIKCTITIVESDLIKNYQKNDLLKSLVIKYESYCLTISHANIKSRENGLYELICEGI
ncbi:MAG: phage head closure protein [Paraclostridium sp.]